MQAFLGGVQRSSLERLVAAAAHCRPQVAQGAAFAAKARQLAGISSEQTEMACEVFCELAASQTSGRVDRCLADFRSDSVEPAYEQWRCRIQSCFQR